MTNAQFSCTAKGKAIVKSFMDNLVNSEIEFKTKLYLELNELGSNIDSDARIRESIEELEKTFSSLTDCSGNIEKLEATGLSSEKINEVLELNKVYLEN